MHYMLSYLKEVLMLLSHCYCVSCRGVVGDGDKQRAKAQLEASVEKFRAAARAVESTFAELKTAEEIELARQAAGIAEEMARVERETVGRISSKVSPTRAGECALLDACDETCLFEQCTITALYSTIILRCLCVAIEVFHAF